MDTEQQSVQKVNSGEENSPAPPAGTQTRILSLTSPALYQRAILAKCMPVMILNEHENTNGKSTQLSQGQKPVCDNCNIRSSALVLIVTNQFNKYAVNKQPLPT